METSSESSAVDPAAIPEKMSRPQLEWWILFTIAVAGKGAKQTEKKMRAFFDSIKIYGFDDFHVCDTKSPFALVEYLVLTDKLDDALRQVKLGKYKLLDKGFRAAIKLDLDLLERSKPLDALKTLSAIPGLGPKGSRMICMYAFPEHADYWVVLDTHVLRWLREQGFAAPKSTPPEGPTYKQLELDFKLLAKSRNLTTRQLDTEIWLKYSRK
jgi:hypothetical protein